MTRKSLRAAVFRWATMRFFASTGSVGIRRNCFGTESESIGRVVVKMDRNGLVAQLRGYGNMEDLSARTDERLSNMIAGYRRKGKAVLYNEFCPYFTGVRPYGSRQWIIGCSRRKGCDITPFETKNWACTLAQRDCAKPKDADFKGFSMCRFFTEARKELLGVKQKYVCKCGKIFEKSTSSDTTGNRLGSDFGPDHECFGCPFVVPIEEGYPDPKIVDYECRGSKKISYRTTADIPRAREWFHVGRVYTLDLDFAREIWEFSRSLDGLEDSSSKKMDRRGACYGSDGRYCLTLYFGKTKAGVASCVAISDKFFAGGSERPGMAEDQEKQIVLALIEREKKAAREKTSTNGGIAQPPQRRRNGRSSKSRWKSISTRPKRHRILLRSESA